MRKSRTRRKETPVKKNEAVTIDVELAENGFLIVSGGKTFVAPTREEMLAIIDKVLQEEPPMKTVPWSTDDPTVRYAVPV